MTEFIAWGQEVSYDKTVKQPPGNSLPIIDFAYARGFHGVELDVQVSKDGVLVLMHDFTLDATTLAKGPVAQKTLEELQQIELMGEWNGEKLHVATFEDALRINGSRGRIMCDLRQVSEKTLKGLSAALSGASFDHSNLMLIAYSVNTGRQLKESFPSAFVMLKSPIVPPELDVGFIDQATGLDAVLVNCAMHPQLAADFKKAGLEKGIRVCVYLHHRGLSVQSLKMLVNEKIDFITTQNHHFFKAVTPVFER